MEGSPLLPEPSFDLCRWRCCCLPDVFSNTAGPETVQKLYRNKGDCSAAGFTISSAPALSSSLAVEERSKLIQGQGDARLRINLRHFEQLIRGFGSHSKHIPCKVHKVRPQGHV